MSAARPARRLVAALTAVALMTATACGSSSTAAGSAGSTPATSGPTPTSAGSAASSAPPVASSAPAPAGSTSSGASSAATESSTSAAPPVKPTTLHVWMQGDTLKDINIVALNAEFSAAHPGVTVDLQEQTWTDYSTKVATGLADASGAGPDVLELGNTQVAQFAGAGALAELDAADFDNASTWLGGLKQSATYDGKLVAIPYYAGVRVGIYRTDLAQKAGVTPPFDSLDALQAGAVKLMVGQPDSYSGLYFPSQYWYEGMSFVWDAGGDIATQGTDGKWTGTLDSAASKAGLTRLKAFVDATSRGGNGQTEANDALVMAQDQAAMFIDASWKPGAVTDAKTGNPKFTGKVGVFVVPGTKPGTVMPQFLGGSDIAISKKSANLDLAKAYTKMLTGQKYQAVLAGKGYIANSTSFKPKAGDPVAAVVVKAASTGRFVPNSKNWSKVEDGNVLQNMFDDILSGARSVDDATKDASGKITELLNG
ncbi:N,N'-diacetylchitobiose transport system substrate-binding protein [Nakamurella sp. UYEF19]|uniref:extracellular solute-binding protein n=1 Tax=Nakamurella sp. UYEF19 TaxID=1756392 RepID=UPI003392945D